MKTKILGALTTYRNALNSPKSIKDVFIIVLTFGLLISELYTLKVIKENKNYDLAFEVTQAAREPIALGISMPYGRASKDINVDLAIAEIEAFAKPIDQGGVGAYPASYSIWVDFEESAWRYGSRGSFPNKKLLDYLDSKGITPVIFLAPVGSGMAKNGGNASSAAKFSNQAIAQGSFDQFFNDFAASASAYGKPVVLRYAWEMNGNWFPWSPYSPNGNGKTYFDVGNTPANYVSAWKHVYEIVKGKAPNVLFYWCANKIGGSGGEVQAYYPGNGYVDYVGFDAYNWNPAQTENNSLSAEYKTSIEAMRQYTSGDKSKLASKPIIVGETGLLVNNLQRESKLNYNTIYNDFPDLASIIYFDIDVNYLFGAQAEAGRNWRLSGKSDNPADTSIGIDLKPKYASFAASSNFRGRLGYPNPTITPTNTPAPTPTLTPTRPVMTVAPAEILTLTLNPSADTFVNKSNPNTNYGSAKSLQASANPQKIVFYKFNLGVLGNRVIKKATLVFKVKEGSTNQLSLRRVADSAWNETSITFNNKPAFEAVITTFVSGKADNVLQIPVTNAVTLRKGGNITFGISSEGSNNAGFYSRESVNKPQLIIEYQ